MEWLTKKLSLVLHMQHSSFITGGSQTQVPFTLSAPGWNLHLSALQITSWALQLNKLLVFCFFLNRDLVIGSVRDTYVREQRAADCLCQMGWWANSTTHQDGQRCFVVHVGVYI